MILIRVSLPPDEHVPGFEFMADTVPALGDEIQVAEQLDQAGDARSRSFRVRSRSWQIWRSSPGARGANLDCVEIRVESPREAGTGDPVR